MTDQEKNLCGSPQCLVDRMGDTLTEQHKAGIDTIKQLLNVQHIELLSQMKELRRRNEKDNDEIYPRLRNVESSILLIQSSIGPEGLDEKIKKVSQESLDAKIGRSWRNIVIGVVIIVIAFIITDVIIMRSLSEKPEFPAGRHQSTESQKSE